MELSKILKKKFTAVTGGVLIMVITFSLAREFFMAEKISMSFGAQTGFKRLTDLSDIFFCSISIWLLTIFAAFYCEDRQYHVDALLSTMKNGKQLLFFRRLQVICTITAGSFLIITFLTFTFCYLLYGYPKGEITVKDVEFYAKTAAPALAEQTIVFFLIRYYIKTAIAFIMLDALIIWISVNSKRVQYSFAVLLGIYFLPAFWENMFKHNVSSIGNIIVTSQPILLMLSRCLIENWPIYGVQLLIAPLISICLIYCSIRKLKSIPHQ